MLAIICISEKYVNDKRCFLNVRLMDAKITCIFETSKMFNKNIFIKYRL
ncbi:hypothetical protein BACEGG_02115 [Bacteroides eggerthii DSM 20697]|nr:hypothetical protein BACEGG_02115 [Bacteroides eggerthii DSM 20697]